MTGDTGGAGVLDRKTDRWKRYGRILAAVLFPERCACCGKAIRPLTLCCAACRETICTVDPPVCRLCGCNEADCTCGHASSLLEGRAAPFYYEGTVRKGILRLKEQGKHDSAEFFGMAMGETVKREWPNIKFSLVVPVPVTQEVRRRRGYNQCVLLAKELADSLGLPVCEALHKIHETRAQKELPAVFRRGNVLGAYDVDANIPLVGATVLLVDDISTTGSTMQECAKMLRICGVEKVYGITAAVDCLSNNQKEGIIDAG